MQVKAGLWSTEDYHVPMLMTGLLSIAVGELQLTQNDEGTTALCLSFRVTTGWP